MCYGAHLDSWVAAEAEDALCATEIYRTCLTESFQRKVHFPGFIQWCWATQNRNFYKESLPCVTYNPTSQEIPAPTAEGNWIVPTRVKTKWFQFQLAPALWQLLFSHADQSCDSNQPSWATEFIFSKWLGLLTLKRFDGILETNGILETRACLTKFSISR